MVGRRTYDKINAEIDLPGTFGAVLLVVALGLSLSSWATDALETMAVAVAGLGPLVVATGLGGRFSKVVQMRANVLYVLLWAAVLFELQRRNETLALVVLIVPPASAVVVKLLPWFVRRLLSDVDLAAVSGPPPGLH